MSCVGGCASVWAQDSRPIAQTEREKYEKKIDELARVVEEQDRKIEGQARLLRLEADGNKLDAEAIRLRDEQLSDARLAIADLRTTIAELRAADTLTKDQIKALEGAVKTCEAQVHKLTFTSWLTGTIGIVVTIGVFVIGILVGKGSN